MNITINGKELDLLPTWKAAMDITTEIGCPLALAMHAASTGEHLELRSAVKIIYLAAKANGSDISEEDVGEYYLSDCENGAMQALQDSAEVIANITNPNKEKSGKGGKGEGKTEEAV